MKEGRTKTIIGVLVLVVSSLVVLSGLWVLVVGAWLIGADCDNEELGSSCSTFREITVPGLVILAGGIAGVASSVALLRHRS
jgi:hypothetical protein